MGGLTPLVVPEDARCLVHLGFGFKGSGVMGFRVLV